MASESRKKILSKYTAFIKVAGMTIPPKILALFGQAADGKKSHDEIRAEYIKDMDHKNESR